MQSLAFLWFEMQMTQQYLREETFGSAQSPASGSPSQKLFRLIGSWFGKLAYNKGKNRREVVRSSR
jgi:hypothetical protein